MTSRCMGHVGMIARSPPCLQLPLSGQHLIAARVLTLSNSPRIQNRGFPAALLDLKARLTANVQGLPSEQPGSLWPKTSLGCLHDRQRLTPDQLRVLLDLCAKHSADLASAASLRVRDAQLVVHQCRSLERTLSVQSVPLRPAREGEGALPPREQEERVASILAESGAPDYWFAASRDGNRRAHYADAHLGVTLVHFLVGPEELLAAVRRFRRAVDAALPGTYHWFDDAALHVTIRAVVT